MAELNYPLLQLDPASNLWDFAKKLLVIDTDDKFLQDQTRIVKGSGILPRPHLHEFLKSAYKHYNIILWTSSQIEMLKQEAALLGVTTHPEYKIAALLDRRCMLNISCDKSNFQYVKHPGILWDTFQGAFGAYNTVTISNDNIQSNVSDPNQGLPKFAEYLKYINKFNDLRQFNHSRWAEITAIEARFTLANCMDLLGNVFVARNVKQRNPLRPGKHLLVLDIDTTMCGLIDGSGRKRAHLDVFLARAYKNYDIAVWSARTMAAIDVILDWLEVSNREDFKIAFQLDRNTMANVKLMDQVWTVKPLEVIWGVFPQFSERNTILVDDREANLRINPKCGLKVQAFPKANDTRPDNALLTLSYHLECIKKGKRRILHAFAESKFSEVCSIVR